MLCAGEGMRKSVHEVMEVSTSPRTLDPLAGLKEGVARSLSQMCVYGMEARKTLQQVHGKVPALPPSVWWQRWRTGIFTSSLTSGIVFGSYFTVYNSMQGHMLAGSLAALSTSVIKIPISNGMRMMHTGGASNLAAAGRKIVRAHSWKGLYSGYRLSLLEDVIELDLRARMYGTVRGWDERPKDHAVYKGIGWGAACGAFAAGITTPFDTIRANLAIQASTPGVSLSTRAIVHQLWRQHGVAGLYRGLPMRVMSNAVKSALFYAIFEMLP
jgi:hypothetical protein